MMRTHVMAWWAMAWAAVALANPVSAQTGTRMADPLGPAVRCVQEGRFVVTDVARLPPNVTSRQVPAADGPLTVSLADGYRLMLQMPGHSVPFVNLKFEVSRPDVAEADRLAVRAQMLAMDERRPAGQAALQPAQRMGVETLALHQRSLDASGPLSWVTMLAPARHVIATAYILNAQPGQRAFATFAEYETLRDEALELIHRCLRTSG